MSDIRFEATTKNVINKDLLCPIKNMIVCWIFPFIFAIDRHVYVYLPERVIKKVFSSLPFYPLSLNFIGLFLLFLCFFFSYCLLIFFLFFFFLSSSFSSSSSCASICSPLFSERFLNNLCPFSDRIIFHPKKFHIHSAVPKSNDEEDKG